MTAALAAMDGAGLYLVSALNHMSNRGIKAAAKLAKRSSESRYTGLAADLGKVAAERLIYTIKELTEARATVAELIEAAHAAMPILDAHCYATSEDMGAHERLRAVLAKATQS